MRHSEKAAMAIHTTLSDAEGNAPCQAPLTMNPAAPNRFIHWKAGERPVRRSVETSR